MKKIEIKKLGLGSVFKAFMYMMIIPIVIFVIVGIVMAIAGAVTQTFEFVLFGLLLGIGYPIMFVVLYGLFGTLMALIYNWLAGKFGGLELTIKDLDENPSTPIKDVEVEDYR